MKSDWVAGAWDVHVHCAPSLFPRWGGGEALVAACSAAGMGGVAIEVHHGSSVELAAALDRSAGPRVLGGLFLNQFVGGLNPVAVEASLALGARIVWLPTIHAARHGSVRERRLRIRLLANHVPFSVPGLDDEQIPALAGDEVWLELCYFTALRGLEVGRVAAVMRSHPGARWVLASDSGQTTTPPSPEALAAFCGALREAGVPAERVRRAVCDEPRRLLQP